MTTVAPSRAWTITISSPAGRPLLTCSACSRPSPMTGMPRATEVLQHLARHVLESRLPPHLRTCQCRERSCAWHRRQAPCIGALQLVLIRAEHGRTWHLTDACAACAAAIPQAAVVREPPAPSTVRSGSELSGSECMPEEPEEWVESL